MVNEKENTDVTSWVFTFTGLDVKKINRQNTLLFVKPQLSIYYEQLSAD